jgi:aldehyde dehydrogenase (NAD+)
MDFKTVISGQRTYFQTGVTRPVEFRRAQLRKLLLALESFEPALLGALHQDLGKSACEAYASELGLVQGEIRHAIRHLRAWAKPQARRTPLLLWPARSFIRPDPYGVALIMGPWNYPVQLLLLPLVGAMAAGNCAVLKASESAPHTSAVLARLCDATFAKEYITVVEGRRDVAEALLRLNFDTIFFTGSTNVGRIVLAKAAEELIPVTLELGGKCPCLVCADAPLATAARRIAWGKFLNAGQTCVAPDYVLVDRRVAADFTASLIEAIRSFYGDEPRPSLDYSRIINRQHLDRLRGYLGSGRIACGGQYDVDSLFMAPTVLTDVPVDAPVMQDEIFGPILPVLEVASIEEALTFLRHRPAPLALYLFTRDRATEHRVLMETRSGGVAINDTVSHIIGPHLPFGGLGKSGMGAYHGQATFDCFSHQRSVLRRSLALDPKMRYPPQRLTITALKRIYRVLLGR